MKARSRPRARVLSALSVGTGSGLRARYLCQALQRLGWDSELWAPLGPPRPYSAELALGAPGMLLRCASSPAPQLAIGVKPYPGVWAALRVLQGQGAMTVMDVDDDDGGYRGGILGAATRALQAPAYWAYVGATAYSSHHPLLRQRLAGRVGTDRVFALEQGVDLSVFDSDRWQEGRDAWRRRHGLHGRRVLGFTAHLNVACQLDVLLAAVTPWLKAHPKAVLLVGGGGPDQRRFQALAAPLGAQVKFLGPLTPEGSAQVLAACDVAVSAYGPGVGNRYRVPMKVGEALAMGRPVVSNLVPGLAALRPFLFETALGPKAYGAALNAALRPAGAQRVRRGQAWARRHLDWTRVAAGLLKGLRTLQPGLARGTHED